MRRTDRAICFPLCAQAALRSEALRFLLPLLLYTALALLMTWPLAANFTTAAIGAPAVPGEVYDSWQHMWNLWWLKEALLRGHHPYFTPMIYYPHGAPLFLHTLSPLNFLVSLPVHALFGLVVAFNFAVIFALVASGYSAYLLTRAITGDWRAALVGGTIFATSGYLLSQALGAHLNLLAVWPLPLAVLALHRAVKQPTVVRISLAGGALALNVLADPQYLLFALLWAGVYGCYRLGEQRCLRAIWPIAAAVGLAVLLTLPLMIATARLSAQTPAVTIQGGTQFRLDHALDLADLLIPNQLHPLWGEMAARLQDYKTDIHIQSKTAYLGVVTLLLAGWGLRQPGTGFWRFSALIFLVLAMGSQVQVAGWRTGLPLPGMILPSVPVLSLLRYPYRFVLLTMLALAVLAAYGTRRLLQSLTRRPHHGPYATPLLTTLLVALIVLDNLTVPFPLTGIYIPPVFAAMGQDSESYAIMPVPVYWRTRSVYMLYQTVHGKPLIGGYLSRDLDYPLINQIPMLRMLAYAQPAYDIIGQDPLEIASSMFSYFHVRYLTLHGDGGALRYNTLLRVARAAAGGVAPEQIEVPDSSFLVYRVQSPAEPLPFLGIGQGWSEPVVQPDGVVQRQIAEAAELLIYSAHPHDVTVAFRLHSPGAGAVRLSANGHPLPPVALQAGINDLQVPLTLTESVTRLELHPDGTGPLTVEDVNVQKRTP